MLLTETTTIKLQKQSKKIFHLSTAYDNTIVYVQIDRPGRSESIVHVNSTGKQLFRYCYDTVINYFAMLNQKQVIVVNLPQHRIEIINLQEQKVKFVINHQFKYQDPGQVTIQTFYQTRTFCIIEQGDDYNQNLILTFYNYGQLENNCQPISRYESQEEEWTSQYKIARLNIRSKIGWWKKKQEAVIQFYIWDFIDSKESDRPIKININNSLGGLYNINNFYLQIIELWEIRPNIYLLVCDSNKYSQTVGVTNADGIINNNYLLDADLKTIGEAGFWFKGQTGFDWNSQLIDCYNLGTGSVFHTFRHQNGQTLSSPIYFIQNETQKIIQQQQWKSSSTTHFFIPGFDSSSLVVAQYPNSNVKQITVTTKRIVEPRQIALHLLLHINQDFDDDLLKDALELMDFTV